MVFRVSFGDAYIEADDEDEAVDIALVMCKDGEVEVSEVYLWDAGYEAEDEDG